MLCVVLCCRRAAERKLTTGVHKCIYRIVRVWRREETCSTTVGRKYAVPWTSDTAATCQIYYEPENGS